MNLEIAGIGRYTHEQSHSQILENPWLFLNVSGLLACRWEQPDGATAYEARKPGAFLFLAPQGTRFRFTYGRDRENWVCSLLGLSLRQRHGHVELLDRGAWSPMAQRVMLTPEAATLWALELRNVREAMQAPLPRNALRAELMVAGILRFLLDAHPAPDARSPAQRFRERIDADEACRQGLEALARACGYSGDHLRLCFQKEFGIAPQRYRMQRRMARAMDLVMASTLSIKDIARHLGFPHLSHFSTAFRQAHRCSPRDALRHYREPR